MKIIIINYKEISFNLIVGLLISFKSRFYSVLKKSKEKGIFNLFSRMFFSYFVAVLHFVILINLRFNLILDRFSLHSNDFIKLL